MKTERTHTYNINSCIDRVRLIRRMNALISSLPRLAQDRPIEMAAQPETLTVRQRQTSISIPLFDHSHLAFETDH